MKTNHALLVTALGLMSTASSSTVNDTGTASTCGALGVMKVDKATLPDGVDAGAIRDCAEHPLALSASRLHKRRCYTGDQHFGCHRRHCWKRCDAAGKWCWTAANNGFGSWISCKKDGDCNDRQSCGKGNCHWCGCSC
ncbi:hypothetical protein PCL_11090 [Purpureocillium lilacinum]|uniref:IDI-2 n=1 Tax=Purpureocillium lilacinum TaxID=33203 RepID=A0A2U3ED75_PURLI|nr:hypothetical protein PCL_11090 [Purpureocillium lilacinum]